MRNGPFREIHPSRTGRRTLGHLAGTDLPGSAVFKARKGNESRWIRCWQCGWPVDTERAKLNAQIDGVRVSETTVTDGSGNTTTMDDPKVAYGCPFCGASESCRGPSQ